MCRAAGVCEPGKEQRPFLGVKQLRGVGWGPEGGAGVGLQRQARAIPVGHVHRAKVSGYCLARRFHSLVERVARAMDKSGNSEGLGRSRVNS